MNTGRNEVDITIDANGRDFGKTFHIIEMPAAQGEEWAIRALLALSNAGVEIPDGVSEAGMAGFAMLGLKAFGALKWQDAKPLLDEMFGCISFVPNAKKDRMVRRPLIQLGSNEDDIQEVATRMRLRGEVLALHMGFSLKGVLSTLAEYGRKQLAASGNTKTSRGQSGSRSPRGSRRSGNSKQSTAARTSTA